MVLLGGSPTPAPVTANSVLAGFRASVMNWLPVTVSLRSNGSARHASLTARSHAVDAAESAGMSAWHPEQRCSLAAVSGFAPVIRVHHRNWRRFATSESVSNWRRRRGCQSGRRRENSMPSSVPFISPSPASASSCRPSEERFGWFAPAGRCSCVQRFQRFTPRGRWLRRMAARSVSLTLNGIIQCQFRRPLAFSRDGDGQPASTMPR